MIHTIELYVSEHPLGLRASSIEQLRVAVRAWGTFLGRPATLADLNDATLNAYLDWLREHRAPDTFRTRRGNLLTLWRFAFEEGLVDVAPRKIRRSRPVKRNPVAWTPTEVLQLIATAERWSRPRRGCRWNLAWWSEGLVRAGYDSGQRLGDLLRVRTTEITSTMPVRQSKTGNVVHVALRPATVEVIRRSARDHGETLAWPLWSGRRALYRHIGELVAAAGIRHGTFRWLRRSAITACERVSPGSGTRLAGHTARSTTERWYIDTSQLAPPPLPPLPEL